MSDAKETAQGLSEGINCIAEIARTLKGNASPPPGPDWLATIETMERALEAIRAQKFTTSMIATDELVSQTSRIREAILRWQQTGQPPQELQELAADVLRSFNL